MVIDDRLIDPTKLTMDAEHLLSFSDPVKLVASCLRDVRLAVRREEAITSGQHHTFRRLEDDVELAYINGWRSALDMAQHLRPSARTPLTYQGFRGQFVRRTRAEIRWLDLTFKGKRSGD